MFLWMFPVVIQKEATCNGLDEAPQRLHKAMAFLNVYDGSCILPVRDTTYLYHA